MPEIESQSQQVKVPLQEAQNWKKEAQAVGRSPSHLKKIEQAVNNAPKAKIDNQPAVVLKRRDALAMQKDKSDFKQQRTQNKQQASVKAQPVKTPETIRLKSRKR